MDHLKNDFQKKMQIPLMKSAFLISLEALLCAHSTTNAQYLTGNIS